jgi:hypothetical protein
MVSFGISKLKAYLSSENSTLVSVELLCKQSPEV